MIDGPANKNERIQSFGTIGRPGIFEILDKRYSWSHTSGMKTAISIPDDLFHSADEAAKNLGLSRSALIQKALEDFLETQNQKSIIEKLNRVYSGVDSSIPVEIQKYQRSQIQTEEW